MKITAIVNLDNLTGIQGRMKDMKHYFEAEGELLVNSIMKNFEEQGRPVRWKPLAAATLLGGAGYGGQRFKRNKSVTKGFEKHLQGKQILISSSMLRNSIKNEATAEHALVGTNLVYAALQNFGGKAGRGHKVFVPARQFVMAQDEDKTQMKEDLRRWVVVGQ
jgi:phage virion morphogenesis protein